MKINLTEQERANLITFLQRASMTGAEVPAYLRLVEILNKAYESIEKDEGKDAIIASKKNNLT